VGPRAGLDVRKISSPTGIRSRTFQPVVSRYLAHYIHRGTANSPVHTVFVLKFSAMFLGVVGVTVAAASCILPASSEKLVGNDGK